jgi:diacylglycerol kinase family enzyme
MLRLNPTDAVPAHASPLRVAVVLNGNAKAVNEALVRQLSHVVDREGLFVSRSVEQSRFISRTIINRGYDVVVCAGGDGTFSQCVTDLLALHPRRVPAFGILRLGTGNALATTLGASQPDALGLAVDLHRASLPEAQIDLPLLRVEGRLAPFAGIGLDSLILEDYNRTKAMLARARLDQLQGSAGYALSIATRSLWRFAFERWPVLTVRNEGAPTQRIDLRGRAIGPLIKRGGVIFRGPAGIAAASTVPYYGFGLKLFPQARQRDDRFQLRLSTLPAFEVLAGLPALFRGELNDERIQDYHCTAVSIAVESPTPLQIGGDEVGRRSQVHLGLTHIRAVAQVNDPLPAADRLAV